MAASGAAACLGQPTLPQPYKVIFSILPFLPSVATGVACMPCPLPTFGRSIQNNKDGLPGLDRLNQNFIEQIRSHMPHYSGNGYRTI